MAEPVIRIEGLSLRYRLAHQKVHSLKDYMIHVLRGELSTATCGRSRRSRSRSAPARWSAWSAATGPANAPSSKVISGVLKPPRHRAGERQGVADPRAGRRPRLRADRHRKHLPDGPLPRLPTRRDRGEGPQHRRVQRPRRVHRLAGAKGLLHRHDRPPHASAIATAWKPDVLVLDEVLAVGDSRFIGRCAPAAQGIPRSRHHRHPGVAQARSRSSTSAPAASGSKAAC